MMSSQDALVAIMVAVSASDDRVSKRELISIIRIVEHLPIFLGYDKSRIKIVLDPKKNLDSENFEFKQS